jgi:hypothetical protein
VEHLVPPAFVEHPLQENAPSVAHRGLSANASAGLKGAACIESRLSVRDELIELAADVVQLPIAGVVVRDGDQHRFTASYGITLPDRPAIGALFDQSLDHPELATYTDGNGMLLAGVEGIRYAIIIRMLDSGGQPCGSLCLFDHQPPTSPLSRRQARMLLSISRQISAWIEREYKAAERERLDEAQRIAQQAANVGIYISERNGEALCSPEFYQQLGLRRRDRPCGHRIGAEFGHEGRRRRRRDPIAIGVPAKAGLRMRPRLPVRAPHARKPPATACSQLERLALVRGAGKLTHHSPFAAGVPLAGTCHLFISLD